jgi:hypothetical protein
MHKKKSLANAELLFILKLEGKASEVASNPARRAGP